MAQVLIGPVKYHYFPRPDARAHDRRLTAVVFIGGIDDRKLGQVSLDIHAQLQFSRRLAPPMLGPTDAGEHQLNHRRIDRRNRSPKAPPGSGVTLPSPKPRTGFL